LQRHARLPLRDAVEQAWLALGGPACYPGALEQADAEAYLERLETLDAGGDVEDYAGLLQAVTDLYARPDSGESVRVQLMTIHKAKGLEFDTVIVPGLGKAPRADDRRLLYWQELPVPGGETVLLFSPVPGAGEENDATHLCGHANRNRKGEVKPGSDTLLALLWPVVSSTFVEALASREVADDTQMDPAENDASLGEAQPQLRRLPLDWQCPEPPPAVRLIPQVSSTDETPEIEFDWAGETARHVGTVVHGYLEYLGKGDARRLQAFAPADHHDRIRIRLQQLGVPAAHLDAACHRVQTALEQVLQDERGRWILSPDDEFLDREVERYRPQLENYARLLAQRESRSVRMGLYFPLLCGWREWSWFSDS